MTLEEAQKIASIIGTADGGCSMCVRLLVDKMNASFPEFVFKMERDLPKFNDDEMERYIPVSVTEPLYDRPS